MTNQELLDKYRNIMDCIHGLGNIYYCAGRYEAYKMIAVLASNLRVSMKDPQ